MKSSVSMLLVTVLAAAGCSGNAGDHDNPGDATTPEVDIPAIAPTQKTVLFNGEDLTGWVGVAPDGKSDPSAVWSVSGGAIRCEGAPLSFLRTERSYTNYRLHLEWRWTDRPTNSGVLIHMNGAQRIWPPSFEAQLAHENAGDIWRIGPVSCHLDGKPFGGIRIPKREPSNEAPPGEWNTYEIDCSGSRIRLTVNGQVQNEVAQTSPSAGFIGFQSEGSPIEFRNIYLEPGKTD